jgi:hypothetical protein
MEGGTIIILYYVIHFLLTKTSVIYQVWALAVGFLTIMTHKCRLNTNVSLTIYTVDTPFITWAASVDPDQLPHHCVLSYLDKHCLLLGQK